MKSKMTKFNFSCLCLAIILAAVAVKAQPIYKEQESETIVVDSVDGNQSVTVVLPRRAIQPAEVAIIVNSQDPQSVNVAADYQQARNIPAENLIQVSFPPGSTSINEQDFNFLKAQVDAERDHIAEVVAYIMAETGPMYDFFGNIIGEAGFVTTNQGVDE
jgi:hypothetical protein